MNVTDAALISGAAAISVYPIARWLAKPFCVKVDWDLYEEGHPPPRGYVFVGRCWHGSPRYDYWKLPLGFVLRTICRLYSWAERGGWGNATYFWLLKTPHPDWPALQMEPYCVIPKWYGHIGKRWDGKPGTAWCWIPFAPIVRPIYRRIVR